MRNSLMCLAALVVFAGCGGDDDAAVPDAGANVDATAACMTLIASVPADSSANVTVASLIDGATLQLSDDVDVATTGSIRVEAADQDQAGVVVSPSSNDNQIVTVMLQDSFLAATAYSIIVPAGPAGLRSTTGLEMCAEERVGFTTAP